MSKKAIQNCLDSYQQARLCFIRTMHSLAEKRLTMDLLPDFEFLDLIIPLLSDKVHSIQHTALATLGKLTNAKSLTQEILDKGVIRIVLKDLGRQSKLYKKTALQVLTQVIARDDRFAALTEEDFESMISCLQDLDADSKITAATALGNIMRDSHHLAERFVQAGILPELVQTLSHPVLAVKRAAAFALDTLVRHGPMMAQDVVSCNVLTLLIKAIRNDHIPLKQSALLCLANIARHNHALASKVVEAGAIPLAVAHLGNSNNVVQEYAAILLQDICKHKDQRTSSLVVDAGGIQGFINILSCPGDGKTLHATLGLGYLASQSGIFAEEIITRQGVTQLHRVLQCPASEVIRVSAAWTLGQIGKHSSVHVGKLCSENVLSTLLTLTRDEHASEGMQSKCQDTLRLLIPRCKDTAVLEELFLRDNSEELQGPLLATFAKILPCNPEARLSFVTSQCLKKLRAMDPKPLTETSKKIIYKCFPEEILNFTSPTYIEDLLDHYYPDNSDSSISRNPPEVPAPGLSRMGTPDSCSRTLSGEEIDTPASTRMSDGGTMIFGSASDVSWSDTGDDTLGPSTVSDSKGGVIGKARSNVSWSDAASI